MAAGVLSEMKSTYKGEIREIVAGAVECARRKGNRFVTMEHFLHALMGREHLAASLQAGGVDAKSILSEVDAHLDGDPGGARKSDPPVLTRLALLLVRRAVAQVEFMNRETPLDAVLFAMVYTLFESGKSHAAYFCRRHGMTARAVERVFGYSLRGDSGKAARAVTASSGALQSAPAAAPAPAKKKVHLSKKEAAFRKYCAEIGTREAAGEFGALVGRRAEMDEVFQILSRRKKNNAMLVGDPGVGKTALAEGLAARLAEGDVPAALAEARMFRLDALLLVAGTRYRGDLEERVDAVMEELSKIGRVILFVDGIHDLANATSSGSGTSIASLFRPAIESGTIGFLGTTTPEFHRRAVENDPAISKGFMKVGLREPTEAETRRIMSGVAYGYEKFHGLEIGEAEMALAVDLSVKFMRSRRLPEKALDLLDSSLARQAATPRRGERAAKRLLPRVIEEVCAKMASLPVESVARVARTGRNAVDLERAMEKAVFGQGEAVKALSDAVYVALAGLNERNRPTGSFLFTGPTGVGKTETARRLAECLDMRLVKFDMSEFQERHSVSELIGSPPGYVGYGDGRAGSGSLVNALDETPSCVVLLDEIEKAHPKVLEVFLQIMDDGRLTSSSGKEVSARNAVLVMTSNAGAADAESKNRLGFGSGDGADVSGEVQMEAVRRHFSPEFRNRLDGIILFRPLAPAVVRRVASKFLREFAATAGEQGVSVKWSRGIVDWLADRGFDPKMGARPMKRALARHVKTPLARMMLFGGAEGSVTLSVEGGEVKIE